MTGSVKDEGTGLGAVAAVLLCALALSGCADGLAGMSLPSLPKLDDINPFAEKPVPLPGKRISVIQQENIGTDLAAADKPIALPPPQQNDSWTQPGGVANNAPGHLALGGTVKSAWSANAGRGSTFLGKLTGSPIVYDGKVYTLDAGGKISAFSASGGAAVLAGLGDAGRRQRPGRLRRRACRRRRPHLCGHRATATWWRSMPGAAASCGRSSSARPCAPRRRPRPSACS